MIQALESVRPQGGAAVIIGNARYGERIQLDPALLNQGKRLLGTWGGDTDPDRDFSLYCRLVADGTLSLAPFESKPYRLLEINRALDDLESRRATRPVIDMSLS
jgi:S-(hydroxymethyl)glutathione dehydrogenase/alcohol dehydrogenase